MYNRIPFEFSVFMQFELISNIVKSLALNKCSAHQGCIYSIKNSNIV